MMEYTIDPFIYRPMNVDPREVFNVIEFENIERGRYLVSIYGRIYDTRYNGYLTKRPIKHRTWSGFQYYENYCNFDTIEHIQEYKSVPLIVLSSFREYKPDYKILYANGDTLDNNVYNLSYGDIIDVPDKIYYPSNTKNKKNPPIKRIRNLNQEQVELVCKLLEKNIHPSMIAEQLNLPWRDVYNIKTLKSYTDISKRYSFKTHRGGIYDITAYNDAIDEIKR